MTKALERLDELDRHAKRGEQVIWPDHLEAGSPSAGWRRPEPMVATKDAGRWWARHPLAGTIGVVGCVVIGLAYVEAGTLLGARAERPVGVRVPPPGVEASDSRLLPEVQTTASGTHAFMQTQPGLDDPVTFDPCRPIHYVVRAGARGPEAQRVVDEAVAEISAATGLKFVADGPTDEPPSSDRQPFQPDRYGERWAPVLIAWSDPRESPELQGKVAGFGGGHPWRDTYGSLTYVTGQVALDSPALPLDDPRHRRAVRAVVMHELAHVVGAGHVDDPGELMAAENSGQTALGPGDREGLARLGRGGCVPGL